MDVGKTKGLAWARTLALAGLLALLGGCDTLCTMCGAKPPGGGNPPGGTKLAPPTELTCGRDGNPDRCVVRVTVWMEGDRCQFSFAPDGLKLSRNLGQGPNSRARVRFVLNDMHGEGFAWVAPYPRAIEFQTQGRDNRWIPDRAASDVFTVTDGNATVLQVQSTNVARAGGPPGSEKYNYILRVTRQGKVCESPDPWVWPGSR